MENINLPFEESIKNNCLFRTFSEDTDPVEFMWHRDKEDRIIEAIHDTDWKIQLDNNLPINIKDKIFIPKYIFHRLIKGSGDLKLKITEIKKEGL